jgi:EAL domain-containing protein (putative c-di-GMP-specific phosphodiesterase class I)
VVVYDPALPSGSAHDLGVQHELRRALREDELRLHYQPQIDLLTGETAGVEALVRWQHPERGLLPPGEFLPAIEKSQVMPDLTEWVLRQAVADCTAWSAAGCDWTVSVNVSARDLEREDFATTVADLLASAALAPERLHLEVTETALATDSTATERSLAALTAVGVSTGLDDFGVGFASLSHLRSLSLGEVKVDRAFVAGAGQHAEDAAVVRALVDLAHGLGLRVCAEGVETPDIARWLADLGCDRAQGYLWSRPVPWPDLLEPTLLSRTAPFSEVKM